MGLDSNVWEEIWPGLADLKVFLRVASKILAEWPRPRIGIDLANLGEILSDLANFKIGDLDLTFKNVTSRDLAPPFQGPNHESAHEELGLHYAALQLTVA